MARYRVLPDWISIDPDGEEPLYQQIFRSVESAIYDGSLTPATYLPSSRTLAEHLGVSRVTVLNAYERLIADGLVEAVLGSGVRVAHFAAVHSASPDDTPPAIGVGDVGETSIPARIRPHGEALAFRPISALDLFPRLEWSRALRRCAVRRDPQLLDYGQRGGFAALREMIARYLLASRGIKCSASQIIIVTSTPAAVSLACSVLMERDDVVALEDPGYTAAPATIERLGIKAAHVPVDSDGLNVLELMSRTPKARMVCVTPCYQWPTGVSLAPERRRALLAWTVQHRAWVLEVDYDGEFQFGSPALRPLKAEPGSERVMLIGSFSRTLAPSIRCAYLVVPEALETRFVDHLMSTGAEPSLHIQAALAEFMRTGSFTRHIQRTRKAYRARRQTLLHALAEIVGDGLRIHPAVGGLQLIADLPSDVSAEVVSREAALRDVTARAMSVYYASQPAPNALHLGFGPVSLTDIAPAVRRLHDALIAAAKGGIKRSADIGLKKTTLEWVILLLVTSMG